MLTKTFARKLLRPLGQITAADIQNEIRAVGKICTAGAHTNIVAVLRVNKLPRSSFVYIDMELCDFNLYSYIQGTLTSELLSKVPHLFLDDYSTPKQKISQACQIMTDIMKGVAYIHSLDEVHRDLKPQNGTIITNLAD
jgi:serine/threonine protein kinase